MPRTTENPNPDDKALLSKPHAVPAERLCRRVSPSDLGFHTTDELEPTAEPVGQERAMGALRFGATIDEPDFNIFVVGPAGLGKVTAVRGYLEKKAANEPKPMDWVYVHNFDTASKPRAIAMPQGRAPRLRDAMVRILDELRASLPALFEGEDYQERRRAIEAEIREAQREALDVLSKKAEAENLTVFRTPAGLAIAPTEKGEVIKPEAYKDLPEERRKEIEDRIQEVQSEIEGVLQRLPRWEKEKRAKINALNEELAELVVTSTLADTRAEFSDLPEVAAYLDAVQRDLVLNVGLFLRKDTEKDKDQVVAQPPVETLRDGRLRRYRVNVLVSSGPGRIGAPIVEEQNPTLGNLLGRTEYVPQQGAPTTDFLLIKGGALHRANGGYLLLDARKLLAQPLAWDALKRTIRAEEISVERPVETFNLVNTVTLDPDPIPLKVRVVLFGDRELYYVLSAFDPEFPQLFKVQGEFDETVERRDENIRAYARMLASLAKKRKLRAIDAGGVARLIEEGSRLAGDSEKLSIEVGLLSDIVREADFWAGERGAGVVGANDVQRAMDERERRADRIRERVQEAIARDILLIDTDGEKVGQINGLTVLHLGHFAFGRPARITASVRLGAGRVTDIEREVELGGPIHSKGVMILWGFLAGRFARDVPLALAASLVFEQTYAGVEGDSASSAELYALLSALADAPISQSYAVTGSVNQMGEVQSIGGVNEKIEGFYDVCKQRGLTGRQGVLIPQANVANLMLKDEVVQAVRDGKFTVHAVKTVDEGIEILTGIPAGERGPDGRFPEGSINARVEERLLSFARARKAFGERLDSGEEPQV